MEVYINTENWGFEEYDFDFRPVSYFGIEDPIKELLTNMKGTARRRWVKQALSEEMALPNFLLREGLKDGERAFIGSIHPSYMGGEYLPDRKENEVEIARFVMDSTTQDVISIRARNSENKNIYVVVDEYNSSFICQPATSDTPLSFGELIEFLNNIYCEEFELQGIATHCRTSFDIDDCFDLEDVEDWRNFISAESEFYPQLQDYFKEEEAIWVENCKQRIIDRNNIGANV